MDRFSGRDDGDKAAPRPGQGKIARGGLHAFVKSASTMGGLSNEQQPAAGPSVTLSRSVQAQNLQSAETAKRVSAAVAAAVAADPTPYSGFQPPSWASPPPAGMVLQGRKGGEVVQRLALSKPAVLIGRLDSADLQLEHASISRQHAVLCFRPDGTAVVMDLNSAHGTSLEGKRMPKHTPLVVEAGQELRFGASTRAFFLCRDAATANGTNRKRNVQWPDESEGPSKKAQPDLETVIGFSDGGSFSAGVGPAAATEKQGRFASAITPVTRPSPRPRQAATSTGAESAPSSPTEAAPEATGGMRVGTSRPPTSADDEDKAAVLKRLAAERFRQFMQSNAQKQSSFYDELPPPGADKGGRADASSPPPN